MVVAHDEHVAEIPRRGAVVPLPAHVAAIWPCVRARHWCHWGCGVAGGWAKTNKATETSDCHLVKEWEMIVVQHQVELIKIVLRQQHQCIELRQQHRGIVTTA